MMEEAISSTSTESSTQSDLATIITPTSSACKSLPSPRLSFSHLPISRLSTPRSASPNERIDGYNDVVRLNGPSSWEAWIASVERLARELHVWDKIAPKSRKFHYDEDDSDDDDEDDDEDDDDYSTEKFLSRYPPHSLSTRRPLHVSHSTLDINAKNAAEFNQDEWQQYWNLHKAYVANRTIYEKEQKAFNKVYKHIVDTVHERYLSYVKADDYSLWEILSVLMARVAPSIHIGRCKALHAYRQAVNMITSIDFFKDDNDYTENASKSDAIATSATTMTVGDHGEGINIREATTNSIAISKLEDWHETYQCTLYTCKKLNVPEVEGEEGLRELLQVISAVVPDLAAQYIREIGSRKRDGKPLPKLRVVARKFYEHLLVGLIR